MWRIVKILKILNVFLKNVNLGITKIANMKKLYTGIFFLCIVLYYKGQEVLWQKDLPTTTQDFLSGVSITVDNQYLLSGSSIQSGGLSGVGGLDANKGYDYHLIKLNQQGNKVWEKYFSGNRQDYLNATFATIEGGFLLAGTSFSNQALDKKQRSKGSSDIWVIKIDENGEEEWQQTIGTKYKEEAKSITQTSDLGFVVVGNTNLNKNGIGDGDVLVTKLNDKGKLLYQLVLGGDRYDAIEKVIATKDGGCLLGLYTQSGIFTGKQKPDIKSEEVQIATSDETTPGDQGIIKFYTKQSTNYGDGDYWLVKLDRNGKVEWEKTWGGTEDDHLRTLALTDTGYVVAGESRSSSSGNKKTPQKEGTDLWLITLDKDGLEQDQLNYSFGNRDILMSVDVINKSNRDHVSETKGFLIGGYTQVEERKNSDDEKFWMLYIDKTGKEQWRKYVEGKSKKQQERLVSAKLQNDGTFLLAGTSAEELGKENWKIVKLGDAQIDELIEKRDIKIYPNPVDDYCYVEIGFELEEGQEAEITLYDMSGKQIQMKKTHQKVTKITTATLPQGIYLVTAKTNKKSANTKIVKR